MTPRAPFWHQAIGAFTIDIALVLLFAAIGRSSHAEGVTLSGVVSTASPFVLGTVVGWLVVRLRRKAWPLGLGPGITVWFATVAFGLLLRWLVGGTFALAFLVVASLTLAALLLGWRAVAERVTTKP
jgi:hypothetical protein